MTFAKSALGLLAWLALCFGVAAVGGYWSSLGLGPWYESLKKPSWNPPNWVFGPVWTALYTMMAVAAWLVWRDRGFPGTRVPLGLFLGQLGLNLAWSGLFFGMRSPGWALADIALMWAAIAATIAAFRPVSRAAAALLAPYLAWVSFAAILNAEVWRLNR